MELTSRFYKTYSTIDELPMLNWLECSKGNFGYLYVKYRNPTRLGLPRLMRVWETIYNQYIKEIGLTEDYEELLEAMRKCTLAICKNALTPSSLNATREAEARKRVELLSSGEGGKFAEFVAAIEKYMGFKLDLREVSVSKFYAYVALMKKEIQLTKTND